MTILGDFQAARALEKIKAAGSYDRAVQLAYEWVRSGHINLKLFKALLPEIERIKQQPQIRETSMNESKLIAEVYEQKIMEKIDPTPGEIAIDEYPSSRDPRVTHKISYCPKTNKVIDLAIFQGTNLIERKEIDPADLHLYNTWYDDSTLKNIQTAIHNARPDVRSKEKAERKAVRYPGLAQAAMDRAEYD